MNDRTQALSDAGVSIWLDDLSRERIESGNLDSLIKTHNVVGVTTNPSIFASALSDGKAYAPDLQAMVARGSSVEEIVTELTCTDVRNACDLFVDCFESTAGYDGRVSIEVDPRLAHDSESTIKQAAQLWEKVDRRNVLIKIPATKEGLPAITATIAAGISVNVTLIFSVHRYQEVLDAYLTGLEQATAAGIDLATIHSVASFFVSRVDTEIDQRLKTIGTAEALMLQGKAALANARLAYRLFQRTCASPRWRVLTDQGANLQRPLWASTGVKNPAYSDTLYVTELVAQSVVNTMPEKTLQACADHAVVGVHSIVDHYDEAAQVMAQLAQVGIDLDDVFRLLEAEGVEKFETSWTQLLATVSDNVQ